MPIISKQSALRAVANIGKWGDTDVFPYPIDNHIFHDTPDEIATLISSMSDDFTGEAISSPVEHYSTLSPVGYGGFRWATQIDPLWNAYLLSCVLEIAPQIEALRVRDDMRRVFSYRFCQGDNADNIFKLGAWRDFQEQCREIAEKHKYVICVDISDFYARIYHHRLENALRQADQASRVTKNICDLLKVLSNNTSYGLPVGGAAARLLSELLLNRVDNLLLHERSTREFCRFADDYRFFVDDLPQAYQALGFLSEKLLRNEGLSLQKSKTRIMTSAEYLQTLDPVNPPEGSSARFLGLHVHYDPYSPTADEDYDRLRDQLDRFDLMELLQSEMAKGRIHTSLTKKLIAALKFMDPVPRKQAVISLVENIETLAPVAPQVMLAVKASVEDLESDAEYVTNIQGRIRNLVESDHYVSKIDLNLAYMVRVLAMRPSEANVDLLIQLFKQPHGFSNTPSIIVQRDVVLAMARWDARFWLSDLKNSFANLHPWVKRAFLISSYSLGDEGKHWRDSVKKSLSPYELIIRDWASQRVASSGWMVPL